MLSPDSIIPDSYNPLDWDRYAYVRNNPINFNDPTGHFASSAQAIHDSGEYATPMEQVIKSYGLTINGASPSQAAAVLNAVLHIGEKLDSIIGWVASSSQAFVTIIGKTAVTFSGAGNGCDASGGNGFVCGSDTWSDPQLYAHEFGHTFSQENGLQPYLDLEAEAIYNPDDQWVMGSRNGSYERTILGFKNGGNRPYMYHGPQYWSDWNSNARNVARNEDYADMFSNWAYDSFDLATTSGWIRKHWMWTNVSQTIGVTR